MVRHSRRHLSPTEDENMAASLRLGRRGVLFGLRLSNVNKCLWATHSWQDHVRHFFQSPWVFGECWQCDRRITAVVSALTAVDISCRLLLVSPLLLVEYSYLSVFLLWYEHSLEVFVMACVTRKSFWSLVPQVKWLLLTSRWINLEMSLKTTVQTD